MPTRGSEATERGRVWEGVSPSRFDFFLFVYENGILNAIITSLLGSRLYNIEKIYVYASERSE